MKQNRGFSFILTFVKKGVGLSLSRVAEGLLQFPEFLGVVGVADTFCVGCSGAVWDRASWFLPFLGKYGNWGIWDIPVNTMLLIVRRAVALSPSNLGTNRNLTRLPRLLNFVRHFFRLSLHHWSIANKMGSNHNRRPQMRSNLPLVHKLPKPVIGRGITKRIKRLNHSINRLNQIYRSI